MKDKLRELAERWSAKDPVCEAGVITITMNQCAADLLAILDAEGDSAAATVGQPPEREKLVSASLAIGGWLAAALDDPAVCAEMKRDINRWFDAAMPSAQAHPARSGVVSDEDARDAARWRKARNADPDNGDPYIARERQDSWGNWKTEWLGLTQADQAIDAAIQGERHER